MRGEIERLSFDSEEEEEEEEEEESPDMTFFSI
jgi:hypothetical protein